jgi:hypothetical protein
MGAIMSHDTRLRVWDCAIDIDGAKAHGRARVALDERGHVDAWLVVGSPETLIQPSREDKERILNCCFISLLRRFGRAVIDVSHHTEACQCWRCRERRGGEDIYATEYRSRAADPTVCKHPDEDKAPVSGDGWLCTHCGDLVPEPKTAEQEKPSFAQLVWPAQFTEEQKARARYLVSPQPPPANTGSIAAWPLVARDMLAMTAASLAVAVMIARDEYGRNKYSMPLTSDNGRDHLVDALQEELDGVVYCKAAMLNGDDLADLYTAKLLFVDALVKAIEARDGRVKV